MVSSYTRQQDSPDLLAASLRYQRQVLVAAPLFKWLGDDLFAAGVADMDIKTPPVVVDEMHGDLAFSGNRYTPFASLGADYAANSITCLSPAKTFNIASCCSAFTAIADDDTRRAFQVENSRLSVNKNNPFANVTMESAFTVVNPGCNQY